MTLPASGQIAISDLNAEIGNGTGQIGLNWVQAYSYYGFTDMNSIHGLAWFNAWSSTGSVSRGSSWTTTNCATNCYAQSDNCLSYGGKTRTATELRNLGVLLSSTNCNATTAVNCNQCGYNHGSYLQGNCNCNCNCYNCNCSYANCVCNCDCNCNCGDTD